MRVLVVDDHLPTVELMELTLTAFGHTVIRAANVAEALELVVSARPQIILSDLMFSGVDGADRDGFALARSVRSTPDCSVLGMLALTGVTSQKLVRRALDSGFHEVMTKPFDVEALVDWIESTEPPNPEPPNRLDN